MTIKKPMKVVAPAAAPSAPATGGAAIASRLRLDTPDPNANALADTPTKVAAIVGFVALIIAGILMFMLYQHWDFLRLS